MRKLNEVVKSPSAFDSLSNYVGESNFPDLYVILTQNRDSDVLTRSNWEVALDRLGGESDNVIIHRFGHWACGWWEALCVVAGTPEFDIATDIESSLENYPILDEFHFCEAEQEEADEIWKYCFDRKERVQYIRNHRKEFEFRDFTDMVACVRGDYFAGYASELCR